MQKWWGRLQLHVNLWLEEKQSRLHLYKTWTDLILIWFCSWRRKKSFFVNFFQQILLRSYCRRDFDLNTCINNCSQEGDIVLSKSFHKGLRGIRGRFRETSSVEGTLLYMAAEIIGGTRNPKSALGCPNRTLDTL